ncbi:PREDICTED: RING finger protein 44-like [Ipomoea nil]|uniref:RING finger protein 44-like n=1 Tax=Ipomoea nil TaxID=35883 RepID=UPI000900AB9F|nr:PREDICTED: RING finger protein 44-like [Ipomoea nil]
MSGSSGGGSGHYYDYMPDQVQRYVQRDEFESVHGIPSRYNWNRSQPGFPPVEEPGNQYNWNRPQPGFHHSRLEEPGNQYNRNRIQTRLPHWEEAPSFPSQDPGYPRRFPNPRRPIGAPLRFNSIQSGNRPPAPPRPPIRVVVLEDSVSANAWQTQLARLDHSPPSRSPPPPPFRLFMQQREDDNPQSSTNESKLTTDEQHKVLAKLRKEIYNPATPLPNLYFRDRNRNTTQTQEASKDKDENWKRCAVCLEDFEAREVVTLTPCNHMFHEDCIVPWVKNHGLCPVCRFAICERLKENAAPPAPPRRTGVPPPRRLLPPPPPARDNDMLAIMRALVLEDDYELQNMIPALLGR